MGTKNTSISIVNNLGQTVFEKENMDSQLQLELESGVYFVKIQNSTSNITKKLIIQ